MSVAVLIAGLMLMTLLHELGHAIAARAFGLRVQVVSIGFGPPLAHFQWRQVDVLLCVLPFGGFVRVAELNDEEPEAPPAGVPIVARLVVTLAGSLANYLIAAALSIALTVGWGVDTARIEGLEVTMVSDHAAKVGLLVGDVVTRADGQGLQNVEQLQTSFAAAGERPVRLEVIRSGATHSIMATAAGAGRRGLGARYVPRPELRHTSALASVGVGLIEPWRKGAGMLVNASNMLSRGHARRPSSPIGVASRVSKSGRWDLRRTLSFGALLSIAVGMFNLLPLPGLDGGRVCLAIGETVLRRRLRRNVAIGIQLAGAIVLFAAWVAMAGLDLYDLGR
jgi:regulator of sigma E protease